jgi:acylpyruvate hydrolase
VSLKHQQLLNMPLHPALARGRKILGVLRNYRAHASELNNPLPTRPLFFLKPTTSYLPESNRSPIELPPNAVIHHEVELAVVIGKGVKRVTQPQVALDAIESYTLALDMTSRTHQDEHKAKGLPWFEGKCFDTFCPIADTVLPASLLAQDVAAGKLELECLVNGSVRQRERTGSMVFDIPTLIMAASRVVTLEPGDVILTGTPSGVGAVEKGDTIQAIMRDGSGKVLIDMKFGVDRLTE